MLEAVHSALRSKFPDQVQTWDNFIEFLAVDHSPALLQQLNHRFEWFFEDEELSKEVMGTYKPQVLKEEFYDHLGEMYMERMVSKKDAEHRGLFLTPMEVATLMAAMTIPKTDEKVTTLDPCVGTGRLLMAGYKQAPNGIFFGVDIDLRALRIAYTNLAIHGIRSYLLHADSLLHETRLETDAGRHNWEYANRWHSCIPELLPIAASEHASPHNLESRITLTQQNDLFNSQKQ